MKGRCYGAAAVARSRFRHPVALVVLGAFAVNVVYVLAIRQYFVQPDELEYVKQALRIGDQWHPVLSGQREFTSWSQLQPVLMAPVFSLLSANAAFVTQHIVNAALMSSTAIPAYLLSMRVSGHRRGSVLVAFLTVAVPWIAISASVLTEVAAYPAFTWALLAVHNAVTRPGWRNDLLGLAGVGLALAARPQLAVLGVALVAAAVAQQLRMPARSPGLARHGLRRRAGDLATAHPILIPVSLLVVAGIAAAGLLRSSGGILGTYSVTTGGKLLPSGFWAMGREALAYVAFGVGVLPLSFALAFVLTTLWRPIDADRHAFAWVSLVTGLGLMVSVGSFSVRFTGGINSRYVFYLAPVMFIATLALLTQKPRARWSLLAGGALATWLIHDAKLALRGPSLVSPDSAFHDVLFGQTYRFEQAFVLRDIPAPRLIAFAALGAIIAIFLAGRRGRAREAAMAALAAVTLWCVVETAYTLKKLADTQRGVSAAFIDGRSWIDAALPDGATAPMLISSFGDPASSAAVWWDTAFWNKQVRRTLQLASGDTLTQAFPEVCTVLGDGTLASGYIGFRAKLEPVDTRWLVRSALDRRIGFAGAQVVKERDGVQIVRLNGPLRVSWRLALGSDTGVLTPGVTGELSIYGRPGPRTVALDVGAAPEATRGGRVRIRAAGLNSRERSIALKQTTSIRLTVRVPIGRPATVRIASLGIAAAPGAPPAGIQIRKVNAG